MNTLEEDKIKIFNILGFYNNLSKDFFLGEFELLSTLEPFAIIKNSFLRESEKPLIGSIMYNTQATNIIFHDDINAEGEVNILLNLKCVKNIEGYFTGSATLFNATFKYENSSKLFFTNKRLYYKYEKNAYRIETKKIPIYGLIKKIEEI